MLDPQSSQLLVQAVSEQTDLLKEIYGDALKPGFQQVGKAISTILGLGNTVLLPIHLLNDKSRMLIEKNLESYRKKLEAIPLEKIIPPSPEIGVPILEKLMYVNDEDLVNLYTTLLANASNQDTVGKAHPSFVNIINSLTPDEAKLFDLIFNLISPPSFNYVTAYISSRNLKTLYAEALPDNEYLKILLFPENLAAYLSNLDSLGIILQKQSAESVCRIFITASQSSYDSFMSDEKYSDFDKSFVRLGRKYSSLFRGVSSIQANQRLEFTHTVVQPSPFGKLFYKACHFDDA